MDEILKRLNKINDQYDISFFDITDEEEIEQFYRSVVQAYNEMKVPYAIVVEVKDIWESI